jgi:hypothetical protein
MSLIIVEMIESNAVQLSCRCFGGLMSIDTLGTLEEKSGIYQNGRERWTTVPQKKKPLGSASSKISESRRTARGGSRTNPSLHSQSRQFQKKVFQTDGRLLECRYVAGEGEIPTQLRHPHNTKISQNRNAPPTTTSTLACDYNVSFPVATML